MALGASSFIPFMLLVAGPQGTEWGGGLIPVRSRQLLALCALAQAATVLLPGSCRDTPDVALSPCPHLLPLPSQHFFFLTLNKNGVFLYILFGSFLFLLVAMSSCPGLDMRWESPPCFPTAAYHWHVDGPRLFKQSSPSGP